MNNIYDVRYEWVDYVNDKGETKRFLAYYLIIAETKISIRPTNEYNQKLIEGARNLGLIKKYED